MGKNTLKLNQATKKGLRMFKVIASFGDQVREILIEGDEISHVDGLIEVWTSSELTAIINDYVLVAEVPKEKTPV